jgi:glycosyltransferase involved in cell wall biosynthesis
VVTARVEATSRTLLVRSRGDLMAVGNDLLVSVVIATYNRAEVVGRAVASVLSQDCQPREVIVVDDGSTDNTASAMAAFGPDVRLIRQDNRERGAARNVGLRASRGEMVVFFDSDDEMQPGHLQALLRALQTRPDAAIAYTEAEFYDDRSREIFDVYPRRPVEGDALVRSAMGNFMATGSVMVRRELLERVGDFDEDRSLSGSEDWELWTRCLAESPVVFVPHPTVRIHFHDRNTVGDVAAMERALRSAVGKILERHAVRLAPYRRAIHAQSWSLLAHHYMLGHDGRGARSILCVGIRNDPLVLFQPSFSSMLVKSLLGPWWVGRLRLLRRRSYLRRRSAREEPHGARLQRTR